MEHSGDWFDVIVIGAGIMGSCTAYQVAKRGRRALLLEQFDFLHCRGSSHGESRTFRPTYPEPYYHALVMESYRLWEEAQSEIGYRVHFKTPQLDMGPADDGSLQAVIANCRLHSIPHRILDRHQAAEEFSGRIALPENWIALSTGLGGVLKPTKAVSMFQTLALQNGAVLRDRVEVSGVDRDNIGGGGGVVVSTTSGEKFRGGKCVITAGPWVRKLAKRVSGLDLPIEPVETSIYYWRIKEGCEAAYRIEGGFPTFASYGEPYVYGTPSLEYPGLLKVSVHGGRACDPDRRRWGRAVALGPVKQWIERVFEGRVDSSDPVVVQSCMYSITPEEDYVIDFVGGELGRDVVVGGGFSGHGFKMGPVVGSILADLALDGEAGARELGYFRMDRFVNNPMGNPKAFRSQVDHDRCRTRL